jgi:hypothetical protein
MDYKLKAMKILVIQIRGEWYHVNEIGQFIRTDMPMAFHDSWQFYGVSTHHWHNHPVYKLSDVWNNPKIAIGGYLWDKDHGTIRTWGGCYHGKLPRITACYFKDI